MKDCIDKYLELSESVFDVKTCISKIPTGNNHAYFDAEHLERALQEVVREQTGNPETPLADTASLICPVFVVTTRGRDASGPLKCFKSYGFDKDQTPIWQAARATTAAPAFFPPALVTLPFPPGEYIDGGVRANNPSWVAIEEGKEDFKTQKCFIVSIGTGEEKPVDFVGDTALKHMPKRDTSSKAEPERSQSERPESNEPELSRKPDPDDEIQETASGQGSKSFIARRLTEAGTRIGKSIKNAVTPVARKTAEIYNVRAGVTTTFRIMNALVELSTNSKEVHERILRQLNSADESAKFPYFRFNVAQGMEGIGMEEWKQVNKMTEMTRGYLASHAVKPELQSCAKGLLYPQAVEST